ncbi:hypothetical protein [Rhodococcus sp. SGAir0479]|uniref:hypothetical protein n=1 Tax=Rhodococcus sp. SGAir0479 TaxID=2567884 RepID=UPI0010CD5A2B|nr:hypothetical protein [Rhodococcus sp. SGAir0479]QCQ89936.1 hypothetical protein E7742_01065 [Rhodococcus sp. SGAir0479]
MPGTTLVERYEDFRTRRFLRQEARMSTWMPQWRSRSRRRALVMALVVIFAGMFATAVGTYFSTPAVLGWIALLVVFLPVWTSLQIVSSRQCDAPRHALDEREIAERNSARSVGLTALQWLVLLPIFALTWGAGVDGLDHRALAYAGGGTALAAVLFGGCLPAMILAWSAPDPDPDTDDHEESS